MNTERVFRHYCHILDKLIDDFDYFKYYFQSPSSIDDIIGEYEENFMPSLEIRFGISRGCLIDRGFGTVVKFNVMDKNGEPFALCEREERIYKLAQRSNFSKYLAECKYVGTYRKTIHSFYYGDMWDNMPDVFDESKAESAFSAAEEDGLDKDEIEIVIPLYAYEEFPSSGDCSSVDRSQAKGNYRNSPLGERNRIIAAAFMDYYGEAEYHDFSDFCELTGIDDLHLGNVYIDDCSVVLLDYAGFNSKSLEY